jgi:hypothetical protein
MEFAIAELSKSQQVLEKAKLIVIKTSDEANDAQQELSAIKSIQKEVEANRTGLVAPLNAQVKAINDAFKKPAEFLSSAEAIIKNAINGYLREQQRLEIERQAKLAELARKEREALEAKAVKAETKGKEESAEAYREIASQVVTPIIQTTAKVAGISVRKQWKAEIVDKRAFVEAALTRPDVMALLEIDEGKLNKLAVALQGEISIPGVKAFQVEIMASRAAKAA